MSNSNYFVLIMDDDATIRDSLGDYFEDRGFRTLKVESSEAAQKIMQKNPPDAVIVDIRMPGMSGDDFIRGNYVQSPNCIFIICTGSPEYNIPVELLDLNRVSSKMFHKPVENLNSLYIELLYMIKETSVEGKNDD